MCNMFKSLIDSIFNIKLRFNNTKNTSAPVVNGDNNIVNYNYNNKDIFGKYVKFNVFSEHKGKGKYVITVENKGNLDARNVRVKSRDRHIKFLIEDDFSYDKLLSDCYFSFNAIAYIGCPNSLKLEVSWYDEISGNSANEIQYIIS